MARTKATVRNSRGPPPRDVVRKVLAEQKRNKREDKRENMKEKLDLKEKRKKEKLDLKEKQKKESKAFEIPIFDAMKISQK